jgi:uncharacterized protein with ParB-like and HNH nuclease domain
MSLTNELELRPISALLNESFFIPAYQRGYRWNPRQVTDLLNDICEFQRVSEEGSKKAFYCLQPVVVKKKGDVWELVDGQQRLTTIYIILSYLIELVTMLDKKRYHLSYETRPNSAKFLENIDEALHTENIDYSHMYYAKKAIQEWFKNRDGPYKLKFLQTLLSDDDSGRNVKVIWYQINEEIDPTAVFTRLNMGKIPLKNAELVKALFLKGSNFKDSERYLGQLKIAQEWDEIERYLQADCFWFFINNQKQESNRIEFILRLVANSLTLNDVQIPVNDPFFVFLTFSGWLSPRSESVQDDWQEIKRCFMTLREWYENPSLFHLIGFLVSRGVLVFEILSLFKDCKTKSDFHNQLISLVFKKALPDLMSLDSFESQDSLNDAIAEFVENLSYDSPRTKLMAILLLFNIATLLANVEKNNRFQFDWFKKESWDIEHIRSVASEMPGSKEIQKLWLADVVEYVEEQRENSINQLSDDLKDILIESKFILESEPFDSDLFEDLFNRVLEIYMPDSDEDVDNSIGNLTLLDSSTNRSYKNAIFPIKRNRIIGLDKSARFVPICTKNAFLKYYTNHVDNIMFWHVQDSENHKLAIIKNLTDFFSGVRFSK